MSSLYKYIKKEDAESLDFSEDSPVLNSDIYQQIDRRPDEDRKIEDRELGNLDIGVFR